MKLRGYWAARRARQETVVLALLAYRPEGWHVIDLRCYAGGWFVGVYATLERLEARGAVTSRWDEGPYPRSRRYFAVQPKGK